ncbi:polyprenol monophosphomannose synthase [Halosquirtibacter xylanolyticus]|uniref:polyprenol monophosphomannose synthase n=1 Tax=Halosquirtibacter xylanolyticus TaxID=3374599 RepID=UPI0037491A0A
MKDSIVIIPTYNEKENIEKMIRYVMNLDHDFHILVIDDGSPDGTGDIVETLSREFQDRVFIEHRSGKQGLGTAYIHGFRWALAHEYEFIYEMDADFSHNPDDLIRLRQKCVDGADLAIGSRYISGINVINWPLGRVLMSYGASMYVRLATRMQVMDATAGFKCYRRGVLEKIPLDKIKMKGYGFQIELKFTSWKYGFEVQEVPIIFTDRQEGTSKMSGGIFSEAFFGVIKMKFNSFFRNYK